MEAADEALFRAHNRLRLLEYETHVYLDGLGPTVVFSRESPRVVWLTVTDVNAPPPSKLTILVHDAVSNLRVGFDELVRGVARVHTPACDSESLRFPIASSEQQFDELARTQLAHVPIGAQAAIRAMQPYHAISVMQPGHPLSILQALAIFNDHDKLPVRVGLANGGVADIFSEGRWVDRQAIRLDPVHRTARTRVMPNVPTTATVRFYGSFTVRFDHDRLPTCAAVGPQLGDCLQFALRARDHLRSFFLTE
jgi:hypothetical protein